MMKQELQVCKLRRGAMVSNFRVFMSGKDDAGRGRAGVDEVGTRSYPRLPNIHGRSNFILILALQPVKPVLIPT
ncbi:hypothetical protein GOBAR_DD12241 [Gossypium barbadense]|nr:hypothetical protein GOBAR_DD12241 [Gossypium barbadense]